MGMILDAVPTWYIALFLAELEFWGETGSWKFHCLLSVHTCVQQLQNSQCSKQVPEGWWLWKRYLVSCKFYKAVHWIFQPFIRETRGVRANSEELKTKWLGWVIGEENWEIKWKDHVSQVLNFPEATYDVERPLQEGMHNGPHNGAFWYQPWPK